MMLALLLVVRPMPNGTFRYRRWIAKAIVAAMEKR